MSRIDRFLIVKSLSSSVVSCDILPCVLSDHDFITLELSLGFSDQRANVWRFNNSLLSDLDFRAFLSSVIKNFKLKLSDFHSLREWWDRLKVEIRIACVSYSVRKKKLVNQERFFLTKQLVLARNALHASKSPDASAVNSHESRLFCWISKEAEGAKIRSRAQWYEQVEKPTRYFFSASSASVPRRILLLVSLILMVSRRLRKRIWRTF